ncbi:MAG: ion transporter [Candidatus Aminicenantales bacterium]
MSKLKKSVYSILEPTFNEGQSIQKKDWFGKFIIALIVLNIAAVILSTVERLEQQYSSCFFYFEVFSVIIFTIEYFFRLWSCTVNVKYSHPVIGRIKFAITPLAVIDFLAILPFYLPMFIPFDLRFLRALRLFRILRLFKMGRYSIALKTVGNVFSAKRGELLITVFIIGILLILSSSLIYYAERDAQPESFSSIPASVWWSVVTLTTVGYGDVYPMTSTGKLFGAVISFLGIGLFALPAGILMNLA